MLAPLATIAFLSVLWLAVVAVARMLEHSGSTVMASLAGRSRLAMVHPFEMKTRITRRASARLQRPMRATPTLRAAA